MINYNVVPRPDFLKGYYGTERTIVERIKRDVTGQEQYVGDFKTVECQVMDIADDIAYSTFDLEDAFAGGFLEPLGLISEGKEFYDHIAEEIKKRNYDRLSELTGQDVLECVADLFKEMFEVSADDPVVENSKIGADEVATRSFLVGLTQRVFRASRMMAKDGNRRSVVTSYLVKDAIQSVAVDGNVNEECPILTKIKLNDDTLLRIECLKHIVYENVIRAPCLQQSRHSGRDMIRSIFDILSDEDRSGWRYLPPDYKSVINRCSDVNLRKRIVCDYISGMTDRFAATFYSRLRSVGDDSIYRPT